jgi:hypothetical protein
MLQRRQYLATLKAEYRLAYCDPYSSAYPKIIEVRNRSECTPPSVGDYIEIEQMCGAQVLQVGGFSSLLQWQEFPFKFEGGVGIDRNHPDDIHLVRSLSEKEFNSGKVWWALLKFEY